jgi:DNA-binding beta-propeller fold protein YncE
MLGQRSATFHLSYFVQAYLNRAQRYTRRVGKKQQRKRAMATDGYALLQTINLPGTLGGHGDWVAYDADTSTIWLAQSPDNNVVVIDTRTNTVRAVIPDIGNANGIALSPQYAFVADVTNNTIDVIDKHTFDVVARIPVTGTTPDSVVYVPSTNQVLVASDDNNVEDFINANAPFTQTGTLQLQPNPAITGPDVATYVASKDLVYQPDDQQIDVINPHTGTIVATWHLLSTGSVKPMVYDPVTNRFIVGTTNNQLLVVDGDSGAVLNTIAISGSVDEASIDVTARRAFFGDKSGVADIVNLDTDQLVGGLPAEKNMHTLAADTNTHYVYVYENNRNTVDIYARPDATHAPYFGTVTHDPSSPGAQIYALYDGLLGRTPDPIGFENWTAALQSGTSLREITRDFLSSDEFTHDFGSYLQLSAHDFIEDLYQTGLRREADPQGLQHYEDLLATGTSRQDVALDIELSPEHEQDLQGRFNAGLFVPSLTDANIARLYYGLLDRAPDAGGLQNWESAAASGLSLENIAQDFISSPEYQSLHPKQTDQQFVDALYQGALGRPPDAPGEQHYDTMLAQGVPRADVALFITGSPEAQQHLASNIEVGFNIG